MSSKQTSRWRVFATAAELQAVAVQAILDAATVAIDEHGRFDIVLAGGTTPRAVYEQLRGARSDWQYWHVWYGDERCLPQCDPERNSLMAAQALLDHVPIPPGQIHSIPVELGCDQGAAAYNAVLQNVDTFDLVLLGVGEDAHTASLFPGQAWDTEPPSAAIAVRNSPKPPSERVSLTAARLSDARRVIFFVTGAGKRDAVARWRGGQTLPVAAIAPAAGADVWLDEAANGKP